MSYCCLFGTFSVYPTSQSARDDTTALQGEGRRAAGVTALEAWFTFDGEKKRNDAVPSSSAPPRTPPRQLVHDHDGNATTSSSDVGRIILTGSLDVPHIVNFRRRWVHAQVPGDVRVDIAQVPPSPFSDDAEDSLSKKQKHDAVAVPPSQSWWNASFTIHGDDVEKALTSLTLSAPSDTTPSLERRERAVSMLSRSFALPSSCGGASAALRGVVHVFLVVCSPPTTAMSSDSITPSSRSPSTTSHSGLSSECAAGGGAPFARVGSFHNAGGTPTSASACRGGRSSVGIHVTPTQEFLDVLVPQILSMHLKYAHRSVYHDALDIMEKQFEAAVEELVGLESTYHREIEMRDEIIASLQLQVQRQHESEASSTMMTAEHTNDTGVMSHTPKKNSDALSSDGAALEQQQPTTVVTSPLKQKDMEIFLLRARVGAIETAKKLELDELRRELETLRSKHQLAIRKNVERAVSAQRKKPRHGQQHPQQQQRSISDRDGISDAPVGSSHKSALVCRSIETAERKKSSSSSRSGSKSRPLSEERHHRKDDAWEPQPHTGGGGGYSARTTDQSNSAQNSTTASRREANETAATAAEERSNRLRRLEESFAKLQSRQAAHLGNIQQHREASNTPLVSEEGETADQTRRKGQDDGLGLPKHRQASPLRIPAVVPGLKLTSEQLQKVAPSGSGGSASAGGGDPELVLVPSSASALSRQSTATTGRHHQQQPSPRVSSVSRNAHSSPSPSSLLRQSPLRLFEQQNHLLHRSIPSSSKGLPPH